MSGHFGPVHALVADIVAEPSGATNPSQAGVRVLLPLTKASCERNYPASQALKIQCDRDGRRDGARWIETDAVTVEWHANDEDGTAPINSGHEVPERALKLNRGIQWWMVALIEESDKRFSNCVVRDTRPTSKMVLTKCLKSICA